MTEFDVVVVGAGQAGLGIGYYLQQAGLKFVIVERATIGESWRSQRWNSFVVNTPNWMNGLPGSPYKGSEPSGFCSGHELVESFERYAAAHNLPIRLGVTVERVAPVEESNRFVIHTIDGDGLSDSLYAKNVVVASGMAPGLVLPTLSQRFPDSIRQLHAADYRSPADLPEGAVVVIGSGQSGCQIAEDLVGSGRTVYLCTSKVARVPRRYRDRDTLEWMRDMGLMDQRASDLADPRMQFAAQPQVSGVGRRGRTVSLQGLQRQGVQLMNRLGDVTDGVLTTEGDLADHITFADDFSIESKRSVDAYIEEQGLDIPEGEDDPNDRPASPDVANDGLTKLDLGAARVTTVIWCTGFKPKLDWLPSTATDDQGRPVHDRGISPIPGVFFLGFPWLHTRKSGIIFGIGEDARHLAAAITSRSR